MTGNGKDRTGDERLLLAEYMSGNNLKDLPRARKGQQASIISLHQGIWKSVSCHVMAGPRAFLVHVSFMRQERNVLQDSHSSLTPPEDRQKERSTKFPDCLECISGFRANPVNHYVTTIRPLGQKGSIITSAILVVEGTNQFKPSASPHRHTTIILTSWEPGFSRFHPFTDVC